MQGIYSGSSARSPETTSVASGIPNGSKTACMTLTCGRSGRSSLLWPNWKRPPAVTVAYALVLVQRRFKGGPPRVVTQTAQHDFKPVIGEIEALDVLACRGPQRPQPVAHPRFDMHKAVINPRQNRAEPDGREPAQAEPLPVTMRRKVGV